MNRIRNAAMLAAAGVLAAAGGAAQAQTVLTMSNWVPPQHPIVIYIMKPWADQVAKVTNGRVTVQMLPKAIAAPNQHYDATINGQVDLAWATYGYQPERFQPYLIAELP
ncbi:MAG: TRAP transporter substrate-binding protein, partial [Burkholderiales bacterium]